jgi:hypothetical protein
VEAANKGGVRGEGATSWLLAVAQETGGILVRHGQGAEDSSTRLACPREEDEGGACTSVREEKGRPGGPAEGHWAGCPVGQCRG